MKEKLALYIAVFIGLFSLQSCVSNYVVSTPITYKPQASLVTVNQEKLEKGQEKLMKQTVKTAEFLAVKDLEKAKEQAAKKQRKNIIDHVLEEAKTYIGTPYLYGGTTRRGIDCSAFVLASFEDGAGIDLPRVAAAQAKEGEYVSKSEIEVGDLLFFARRGGRGRISHVGIVEEVTPDGEIKFIHASSSRGVMISSLHDVYWHPRFAYAKRIVDPDFLDTQSKMVIN